MVQRTQTDYETREIEETVYECDRCGTEGAENHLYGELAHFGMERVRFNELRADRVADYCGECVEELTHPERVNVSNRETVDDSEGFLPDYDISVNVKPALAAMAILLYNAWFAHLGYEGTFTNDSGEVVHGLEGVFLGLLAGWAILLVGGCILAVIACMFFQAFDIE